MHETFDHHEAQEAARLIRSCYEQRAAEFRRAGLTKFIIPADTRDMESYWQEIARAAGAYARTTLADALNRHPETRNVLVDYDDYTGTLAMRSPAPGESAATVLRYRDDKAVGRRRIAAILRSNRDDMDDDGNIYISHLRIERAREVAIETRLLLQHHATNGTDSRYTGIYGAVAVLAALAEEELWVTLARVFQLTSRTSHAIRLPVSDWLTEHTGRD